MLPTCLLPSPRPVIALMGMSDAEFHDLYVGDGQGTAFDAPDVQIIDAFNDLVEERATSLLDDWRHREATIDIVSCFAPIASDVASLDRSIMETSRWLSALGPRTTLRALGAGFQAAEALAERTAEDAAENEDDTGFELHSQAVDRLNALAETCSLHLAFGDVWIRLSLLADRVRVMVDLPQEGEIDMGGHRWDGDEDSGANPVVPPLETV